MATINQSAPLGGPSGPGEPKPNEGLNKAPNRITELAKKALELVKLALYHTGLMLVKIVVLPILLASTAVAVVAFSVGQVFEQAIGFINKN